ncbi:hypothetical protein ACFYPC_24710 [Streptomyces sp. NPDC005808]|uniref:hypothetical protein n=1 Tax=Streptomyces sp. NPDC005808 TaxID=3364734 RepID=UPI00367C3381
MTRRIPSGTGRSNRPRRIAAAFLATLACGAALASCGSDGDDDTGTSVSPRPTAPDESSFAGEAPSALASEAASAVDSAQASASAAASSVSAEASAFEASVSADTARAAAAAEAELKNVRGGGNARSEVAVTGLPRAQTGGLLAVLVAITNKTEQKASYAVQIDFEDADGKVVETRFVGAQDLEPGKRAEPVAISREPVEPKLTPRLAKAQRY